MNKSELISAIAREAGVSLSDASKVFDATVSVITKALKAGDKVQVIGFGTFSVRVRSQTTGRNPRTGESMVIPESRIPAFKAGKSLRDGILS
ncbi:HU family DNA-binding protein [Candidatus Hydrogenosomobacter endosymbioticus]|uniref:DNA-binding protein HU-beta n=1 Tax=Candidatus Hydrogenosomobacter endosymbioticus TaxID=2558174 RepID=A0ABN6L3P3_9PROT|nr:HU family DNA-binding protein [Candidatus Hydrogenosomobacter endosymbioticus]BDB96491.1 DNA-binding protein HU-beta [Candidatus Hydrogenosomobacter endosymbioticus]